MNTEFNTKLYKVAVSADDRQALILNVSATQEVFQNSKQQYSKAIDALTSSEEKYDALKEDCTFILRLSESQTITYENRNKLFAWIKNVCKKHGYTLSTSKHGFELRSMSDAEKQALADAKSKQAEKAELAELADSYKEQLEQQVQVSVIAQKVADEQRQLAKQIAEEKVQATIKANSLQDKLNTAYQEIQRLKALLADKQDVDYEALLLAQLDTPAVQDFSVFLQEEEEEVIAKPAKPGKRTAKKSA